MIYKYSNKIEFDQILFKNIARVWITPNNQDLFAWVYLVKTPNLKVKV